MNCSKSDIVLIAYPFSDLSMIKTRPAIVVSVKGLKYDDVFIVPLTSKIRSLEPGEFILTDWQKAGLPVATACKRGCYLVSEKLIIKKIGQASRTDISHTEESLRSWLDL
jgi:mRNA interferase MazF